MNKKPIFYFWYFYIHSILEKKAREGFLKYKEAKKILFQWRIPKFSRELIIKELENLGLVKRINKGELRLNKSPIDINNHSEVYRLVGCYPKKVVGNI